MRPNLIPILSAGLMLLASLPARPEGASIQFSDGIPLLTQPPTLAQALQAAEPPRSETFLVVGAEHITLPKGAPAPGPQDRAYRIGQEFGCVVRTFHNVIAIAPPTMTVLNAHPRALDPYAGVPTPDAFRWLISMLDRGQWKALSGPDGIGLSDLSNDAQRQLFVDIFPEKPMALSPQGGWMKDPPTLSRDKAIGSRLRLTRQTFFNVSAARNQQEQSTIEIPRYSDKTFNAGYVFVLQPEGVEAIYGDTLAATVANTLKESDLDYDAETLDADVDVTGVTTLGALVTRIGVATRMELYADRRYEKQTVLILGPHSGRARDFLKATALGVRGTFRKVGPAYVLTNDRMGVGTRQVILNRFLRDTSNARQKAIADANDALAQTQRLIDIPDIENTAALSDAQIHEFSASPDGSLTITTSLSKLTPEQQAIVLDGVRKNNASVKPGFGVALTVDKPIGLWICPRVTLTSSKIYGTVMMNDYLQADQAMDQSMRSMRATFHKEQAQDLIALEAARKEREEDPEIGAAYGPAPRPVLDAAAAHFGRRAVIVRPKNAHDLDHILAVMKRIGFNQLWMDVFSDGESHLSEHPDILEAAIAKTKGTGIIVIPHVDALDWGENAPEEVRDLTMMGETSLQDAAWRMQDMRGEFYRLSGMDFPVSPQRDLWVSPSAPFVANALTFVLHRLAATPGVAAIAISHAASAGYGPPGGSDPLGYTQQLRLAFLRRDHIDPLDFNSNQSYGIPDVTHSIPEFQENDQIYAARKDWEALRAEAQKEFHKTLFTAGGGEKTSISLFVCADTPGQWPPWYSLWDDSTAPVPQYIRPTGLKAGKEPVISEYAHAHWRRNLTQLPVGPGQSREQLIAAVSQLAPGWDGFVVDFTSDASGDPFGQLSKRKRLEKK